MRLPRHQYLRLGHRKSKARVERCATVDRSSVRSTVRQLLDSFWEARGVLDPINRKRLVDAAEALDAEVPINSAPLSSSAPLPGLPASWQLEESTPEVLAASRRLLALQQLLGGGLEPGSSRFRDGGGGGIVGGPLGFGSYIAGAVNTGTGSGCGRSIDVVWMVVREPGLLSADLAVLTGRLLEMKLATYGTDVDVLKVIEAQPALLLSDRWQLDLESLEIECRNRNRNRNRNLHCHGNHHHNRITQGTVQVGEGGDGTATADDDDGAAAGGGGGPASTSDLDANGARLLGSESHGSGSSSSGSDNAAVKSTATAAATAAVTVSLLGGGGGLAAAAAAAGPVQQLVQAWQYGIASDGDEEWSSRLAQLSEYAARHGDTCVGFRDGDDPELSRWATKQRADWRRGRLEVERLEQLSALGFHFDADEAEWCRWFSELASFSASTGHASPMPLVTGCDMYLINWCSVQRIARRSRVLSESRIQRLDELGFDWTGADPLS
ncbi:hypothetical protein VOLCADRAFT_92838 [Volvox carteri f. nagariensis]|uniref:Helicase-associated domain-containing protein n=1 Tax=Volvox carteri f. nagariensis TaxID=3068 RepID=D8U0L4_VOLCA|nr:uncharacterized protein VOLCADRAFT_92838 [Volvox carteri f. nagariensis]EFJ46741.1 hypothetical protein VOLCADRAFT_92838 [Volvox carteri f. nagariensis]|eukprot:XP_002952270.1 hypothetical protein VOLCADRAFT_92838 [Volvox carteri f. nagariensis]